MKAIHVKDIEREGDDFGYVRPGKAAVYRLEPPLGDIEFVFVSTSTVLGAPETYAFHCDENGKVDDYGELEGSAKGVHSHADVLGFMGYEL